MGIKMTTGLLVLLLSVWAGVVAVVAQSPATDAQNLAPPGGMQLVEGYQHRRVFGFDTARGVIWKDGGPRIDYEIDTSGPNQAKNYPQTAKGIWRTTMKVNGVLQDVVLDTEAHTVVVTIGSHSNFSATSVKSNRDLTEILLMITSYDVHKLL